MHGIPNKSGGDKREVFIKIADGKYEDSDHVQDVADMLEYANISTYRERRNVSAIKTDSGISLNLGKYKTKLIFAQMQDSASEFKDTNSKLASILADIKWYEHATGNGKGLRPLYDEFAEQLSKADLERVERLSQEVFLMRRMIAAARRGGESPDDVARRLGFGVGKHYSSKKHLEEGWEFNLRKMEEKINAMRDEPDNKYDFDTIDDCMKILHELDKTKDSPLTRQLEDLISKKAKGDANKITEAKDLLQKSIDKAGGWQALEKAMQSSGKKSAGKFRSNLADAVLKGRDENQIAEAIILYRIIAVVRRDGEQVPDVARRLGFGVGKKPYSSKKHLEDGWEFKLDELQEKLAELKDKDELSEDAIETIDDCMDILRDLHEPEQLHLSFAA